MKSLSYALSVALAILGIYGFWFLAFGGLFAKQELSTASARALTELFSHSKRASMKARFLAAAQPLEIEGFHNRLGGTDCCLFISHAGGAINGISMTNSLEALENSYSEGKRIIELDFLLTSDGELVLAHDWDQFGGRAPSAEVWRKYIEQSGLTPLDIVELSRWLLEKQDVVLLTDTKDDFQDIFRLLRTHLPIWFLRHHFVFQVYNINDLELVLNHDQKIDTLLTLYKWTEFVPENLNDSQRRKILGLTMPLWRSEILLEPLRKRFPDLPLYLHAPPDRLYIGESIRPLVHQGASGFYMD